MNNLMNKYLKHIGLITLLITGSLSIINSQLSINNTWNLEKCINYATKNNLDFKTSQLNLTQIEIQKKQTKYALLPSLSGGASHGYNWGQKIDPFTNQFATDRVRSNSLYLSSNVTLFSGLRNYYLKKKTNSDYLVQKYNNEIQKRNLKIEVTALFLQALLNQKTIAIANKKLNYSVKQKNRIQILIFQEHKTKYDLYEIESQLAMDSLVLVKAKNEYKISVLQLKQYLSLKKETTFEIDTVFNQKEVSNSYFKVDYENLIETNLQKEQQKINTYNLKIAKSGLYPTLSLSASLGSGYSGNNKELVGQEYLPKPFDIQLQNNFYQTVTLNLSIPIFNGYQTRTQINSAKIEIKKAQIQQEKISLDLENKIEKLKIEIDNLSTQIQSTKIALFSTQKAFEVATLKYESGTINFYQYSESRNKLFEIQSEYLQVQFRYSFKVRILECYSN